MDPHLLMVRYFLVPEILTWKTILICHLVNISNKCVYCIKKYHLSKVEIHYVICFNSLQQTLRR